MKPSFLRISLCFAALVVHGSLQAQTESAELTQARARLLADYERGQHDDDNDVKTAKAEIARLEYLASHPRPQAESAHLLTVTFSGGPISALIAAADKSSPDGFNVVGEKADLALELPPFSIRNADPSAFAGALDGVLRQRGYTLQMNSKGLPGQAPVFTLRKLASFEMRGDQSPFQSFQLASFLESQTVDDIIGAIRMAWELDTNHKPDGLRLKFHPPTGILLVSGPPEGINLVESVLKQLKVSAKPGPKPVAPSPSDKK